MHASNDSLPEPPVPRPVFLLVRQLLWLLPLEYDVRPFHACPLHHALGAFIPYASEHVDAYWLDVEFIHERSQVELLAAHPLFRKTVVQGSGLGLL